MRVARPLAAFSLALAAAGTAAPAVGAEPAPAQAITFVSYRDGVSTVHLMSPDGSEVRPITRNATGFVLREPSLAPDGKSAAVVSTLGAPSSQDAWTGAYDRLHLIDSDGRLTRISDVGHVSDPTFAPDGSRLAFAVRGGADVGVYTIHPDGSGLTRLTPEGVYGESPAYSPDGSKITYASPYGIVVMNSDGSGPLTVTQEKPTSGGSLGYATPVFSPDGSRIVFARKAGYGGYWSNFSLYTVEAGGGVEAYFLGLHSSRDAMDPTFSPDGSALAFASYQAHTNSGDSEVYVVDADGSDPRVITTSSSEAQPSWGVASIVLAPEPVVVPPAPVHPGAAAGTGACAGGLPPGYNVIVGTAGDDTLVGLAGPDVIYGLGGRDLVYGQGGNDLLCGGGGNDVLNGGDGADRLVGGSGQDRLLGGTGSDLLEGEADRDYLDSGPGVDQAFGGAGDDEVRGGEGNDRLRGGDGNDLLKGGAGNDDLRGDKGRDRLYGEAGKDRLDGGPGNDLGVDMKRNTTRISVER